MVNRITIYLNCFCVGAISAVFWQKLPSSHSMALMIAILLTSLAIIMLLFMTKTKENNALPEVLLCWAVSGLLTGVLWVASVGHFYYAWQLPQGKIQQDVTISGRVLSGGCVSNTPSFQDKAFHYVVAIESINRGSVAVYLDSGVLPQFFARILTTTFHFKASLSHKRYEFDNGRENLSLSNLHSRIPQHPHQSEQHQGAFQPLEKLSNPACLHNGDTFTAVVKLKPAYGTANPVGANRQQQLVTQFIHTTGYIKSIKHEKTIHDHSVRYALATTLQDLNLNNQAWWTALLLGDKTGFTSDDWLLLQRTGTGHIFSISGMHLSLIAGVCLLIFNPFIFLLTHIVNALGSVKSWLVSNSTSSTMHAAKMRQEQCINKKIKTFAPVRIILLIVLVVTCFFYALLSGSALPVVRALILLVIGCALSLSRNAWRPVNIALTMLFLSLLLFPFSMLSASFYLSVGAVVCIWFLVVVWGLVREPWYVSLIKLQIALTVMMLPLTLIWFGNASFISIVANLIALPVITLLLPICLISLLILHLVEFTFAQQVTGVLMHYSDVCLGYLLSLLNILSEFSLSAVTFYISSSAALCLVGAFIVFLLPTWRYKAICVVLLLVPIFGAIQKWIPTNDTSWTLHVFDAGQASAIAVTKGNRAIIIDSGAQFEGIAHTATSKLLPFLESTRVSNIDVVIHTHSDNDHAGGAFAIKQHPLATKATFYTPISGCERGKRIRWQDLTISFLWPLSGNKQDNNAMSCVVKITSDAGSVLIPGDIERASEYALITRELNEGSVDRKTSEYENLSGLLINNSQSTIQSTRTLSADILVAPHHGSKTSSTNIFIEQVAPQAVIYTQGYENRWEFPARVVANRYEHNGVKQYLTSYHGYIRASFDENSFYIDTQRTTLHKRWYLPGIAPRHLQD